MNDEFPRAEWKITIDCALYDGGRPTQHTFAVSSEWSKEDGGDACMADLLTIDLSYLFRSLLSSGYIPGSTTVESIQNAFGCAFDGMDQNTNPIT